MRFGIVTLFPEMFIALSEQGVVGRAFRRQQAQLEFWNPRDFTEDVHRTVDDRPYGGGPGMVMKLEPLRRALLAAKQRFGAQAPVIYLSPQGKLFDQQRAAELARQTDVILLCGRYEGIDQRVIDTLVDEEVSIGDYVLSGGEPAALVVIDAVVRLLPGVLGHEQSAVQDSFVDGLLDCPHYTRPEVDSSGQVPAVLLSGDHQAIARWRLQQSLGRTRQHRPELLEKRPLTHDEQRLLDEYVREQGQD